MKQLSDPRSRRRPIAAVVVGLIVLLLVGLLWWERSGAPAQPEPETAAATPEVPVAADPSSTTIPDAADEVAPMSGEGDPSTAGPDAQARALAQLPGLSANPLWLPLISRDAWMDLVVAAVDALADGEAPSWAVPTLRPEEPFSALQNGDQLTVDPSTYARYDRATDLVVSLDPERCAALYESLLPALQASYLQLGREEPRFADRLRQAVAGLRDTPVLDAEPLLVDRPFRYDYADPRLQASTDAQKQMLRLGPANLERVREWLDRALAALDARGL